MSRREETGFTLLELVAVLAIFALVAVMAVQALQGTLRSQRALDARAQDTAGLTLALARLRADLQEAAPLAFTDPGGVERPALLPGTGAPGFGLSLAGQPAMPGAQDSGLARVEWRLEEGRLMRRLWPTLIPADAEAAGPFRPVLEEVRDLKLFTWTGDGWAEGWTPPADAEDDLLPPALRIELDTARWGPLVLTESYR